MRLKEQDGIAVDRLPFSQFRTHLRLGSGFDDDGLQDTVLEAVLRAAIAAIEARTGKVLLERTMVWHLNAWRQSDAQALPVAPVSAVSWMKLVSRGGEETPVDLGCIVLEPSTQRPMLRAGCSRLPVIPVHGYAEVGFVAGYASDWAALPADLAQAVMLLATHFYEVRHEADDGHLPTAVTVLIERYRTVRILGGSAA